MQANKVNINKSLNFSRWSRKAYAAFISIGKIVKISTLKIEVAQGFIKKAKSFTEIELYFKNSLDNNNEQDETEFALIPVGITTILSQTKNYLSGLLYNSAIKLFSINISVSICLRFFILQNSLF